MSTSCEPDLRAGGSCGCLRKDLARIEIKEENLKNLEKIAKMMEYESADVKGLDEALAKVLTFYRRFVPYS